MQSRAVENAEYHSNRQDSFKLRPVSAIVKAVFTGSLVAVSIIPVQARLPVPHAVWVSQGRATNSVLGNKLDIHQHTDKVILNWKSFDVGEKNHVQFHQPRSSSIALNRIFDNKPSEILGKITANGQIYLYNQNGFLFGKNSVIDVNTFVASSLNITEKAIENNIAGVFDVDQSAAFNGVDGEQYSYAVVDKEGKLVQPLLHEGSPVAITDGMLVGSHNGKSLVLGEAKNLVDYEGNPVEVDSKGNIAGYEGKPIVLDQNGQLLDYQWDHTPDADNQTKSVIKLESGARIRAAEAGTIILAADKVVNAGAIETDKLGQIILVGVQDKVYLQQSIDKESNLGFNGILVEMDTGGEVTNKGNLLARLGNVTMAGFAVNQEGRVSATTSASVNGSIRLIASEAHDAQNQGGTLALVGTRTTRDSDLDDGLGTDSRVEFGKHSMTDIMLEQDSAPAVDQQKQKKSRLDVIAKQIHMREDSAIQLKSGTVNFSATENPNRFAVPVPVENQSQIILEKNSRIDVSGVGSVVLPMERNILEVELRSGDALKDSHFQKGGILEGKTVRVDAREGTSLFDIGPALAAIKKSVGERNTEGGNVNLVSEGTVDFQTGSEIDFSGGKITFKAGEVSTTSLLYNGSIVNISEANPNLIYDGVLGVVEKVYKKWGVTKQWKIAGPFNSSRREQGYVQGMPAGSLSIKTNKLLGLDGRLKGHVVAGLRQRNVKDKALGGALNIILDRFKDPDLSTSISQPVVFSRQNFVDASLETQPLQLHGGMFQKSGIQAVNISSNKASITIEKDSTISLAENSRLQFTGSKIDIQGKLSSKSGDFIFSTEIGSSVIEADRDIVFGSQALVDTSGNWVNDASFLNANPLSTVATDGGSITANAFGDITLAQGSILDVSGGAWSDNNSKLTAGAAGTISLRAKEPDNGSSLTSSGVLRGFALEGGGQLNLETREILISDHSALPDNNSATVLSSGFFSKGGFSSFNLTSNLDGITFDQGLQLSPVISNYVLQPNANRTARANSLASVAKIDHLLDFQRDPVNISAALTWTLGQGPAVNKDAAINVKRGANIVLEPGAELLFSSEAGIFFDGRINAPSGNVTFHISVPANEGDLPNEFKGFDAAKGIWLGKNASIKTNSASRRLPHPLLNDGEIFAAGDVSLIADRGYIVAEKGSQIDVSGGLLNVEKFSRARTLGGTRKTTATLTADAGTINMTADSGIFSAAELRGQAAKHTGAAGGELNIELSLQNRQFTFNPGDGGTPFPEKPHILQIAKNQAVVPDGFSWGQALDEQHQLRGMVNETALNQGGFDSIRLAATNNIAFSGDVAIKSKRSVILDAPILSWHAGEPPSQGSGTIDINSGYVALGPGLRESPNEVGIKDPSAGQGILNVRADWIDLIGESAFQGIGKSTLASHQDLRLRGVIREIKDANDNSTFEYHGGLSTAGDLELSASQIYNATLTDFNISIVASDETQSGVLKFSSNNSSRAPVLSAGGSITASAPVIEQFGVLKSPQGKIDLKAETLTLGEQSITSVSLDGATVPFGTTEGGLTWLFPVGFGNEKRVFEQAPDKKILLDSDSLSITKGAVIDIAGNGDLLATEFVKGPGGTIDILDTRESFAIIPGLGSLYAPYDPMLFDQSGIKMGDSLYLSTASNGLGAGEYALLPARYALMPGAYLVTPENNLNDIDPGVVSIRDDGASIVAGMRKFAGSSLPGNTKWSAFAVQNNVQVNRKAEYTKTLANSFFSNPGHNRHLNKPDDAGHVTISANNKLVLEGTLLASGAGNGLDGLLDIAANALAVVPEGGTAGQDIVAISDQQIRDFGVPSLLLGGKREFDELTGETRINVVSETVAVESNASLELPEILLAAKQQVQIKSAATISGTGNNPEPESETREQINVTGDGALLRVSSGQQALLNRSYEEGEEQGITGDLLVDSGAKITADASILMDSSRKNEFKGDLEMEGGSINIGAQRINLGEVTDGLEGMNFTNTQLAGLTVDELILTSRENINVYGNLGINDSAGKLSPLNFKKLGFNAAGLTGFDNDGKTAAINAETVSFENSANIEATDAGNGTGGINVQAQTIAFGDGEFTVQGYKSLDLQAQKHILAQGKNSSVNGFDDQGEPVTTTLLSGLTTDAQNVNINTYRITGESGSDLTVNAADADIVFSAMEKPDELEKTANLAVNVDVNAASIGFDTRAELPAGRLQLHATTGDISIGENAYTDVAGTRLDFNGVTRLAHGGAVQLTADQGNIAIAPGATFKLADPGNGADSGSLTVQAPDGVASIANATLLANSNNKGGRFIYDVDRLGDSDLAALGSQLKTAGFTDQISISIHADNDAGNLLLPGDASLTAHKIALRTDKGSVTVAGTLDASGAQSGEIELAAGDAIEISDQGKLLANAKGTNQDGGSVRLYATDTDSDGVSGIAIADSASIDVSSDTNAKAGTVWARVLRKDTDGDGVGDQAGMSALADGVVKGGKTIVEAVKVYQDSDLDAPGIISSSDMGRLQSETQAFMDNRNAIETSLGGRVNLLPGIEIQSQEQSLQLVEKWDLVDWRYPGEIGDVPVDPNDPEHFARPGVLTLRASGDLEITQDLSDAFKPGEAVPGKSINDLLQPGNSWSYRLIAGADLSSASPLRTHNGENQLVLHENVKVRTGTGFIDASSSGDIILNGEDQNTSVIYTMGRPLVTDQEKNIFRYGGYEKILSDSDNPLSGAFYAEYPIDGGDISISSGGDIIAGPTRQLFTDWMFKVGNFGGSGSDKLATAWGIALDSPVSRNSKAFRQGIGALAGGNVAIQAQGNIENLSVVIPTTGKAMAQPQSDSETGSLSFNENSIDVQGGGNLDLDAGGDVAGGVYFVDLGKAQMQVGGNFKPGDAGSNHKFSPLLFAAADSQFDVLARGDLHIESISNPTTLPGVSGGRIDIRSWFFSYTELSSANLTSYSGDITLHNNVDGLVNFYQNSGISQGDNKLSLITYPGSLNISSLSGQILLGNNFSLFPSRSGQLEMIASGKIGPVIGTAIDSEPPKIRMADSDIGLIPTVMSAIDPSADSDIIERSLTRITFETSNSQALIHNNDKVPVRIISGNDNIEQLEFFLPKATQMYAGNDIRNIQLHVQNVGVNDITVVESGRDINMISKRDSTGNIGKAEEVIKVSGPGMLQVLAGRNIDLGSSQGIQTIGNIENPALPEQGADVFVLSGAAGKPDYLGFTENYLLGNNGHAHEKQSFEAQVISYMNDFSGQNSYSDKQFTQAWQSFTKLSENQQQGLFTRVRKQLSSVFFNELRQAGSAAAAGDTASYEQAYQAIDALFPKLRDGNHSFTGDLKSFFSKIETRDGGDIDILVPGGLVNAGLAIDISGDESQSSDDKIIPGIVALKTGDINTFAGGDVMVNLARIMTLDGGDTTIFSLLGDIDAGRGAKSSLIIPPPTFTIDPTTKQVKAEFPPAVSGSGIRTAASTEGVSPGDVFLFAPGGIIDAGEAGIGGTNVTIAATEVLGADNIDIGGVSVGVPTASTGSLAAGLTGVSNVAASVSKAAEESIAGANGENDSLASAARGVLSVEVIGFGNEDN